jgi:cyclomaltodextrinase
VVALNLAGTPAAVPAGGAGALLAGAGSVRQPGTDRAVVELGAHGWAILEG